MKRLLFFVFCLTISALFSQIGPRSWQDHLSINSCNSVTRNGSMIYASYYNGLIRFNDQEQSIESVNKINGLSDIGIRLLRTNPYNNKVLVVYDNCNIDVIDINLNITNYPDIKLKSLSGKKLINEVTFDKQYAYLACGFGIVVFDTDKLETKDTYIIGPNASNLEVNQLALNDSWIFAATPVGMYRASRNTVLNNYNNWHQDTINISRGPFCGVQNVQGNIISCYCPSTVDVAQQGNDSVYTYVNNGWIKYPPMASGARTIRKMGATYQNLFSLVDQTGLVVTDVITGTLQQNLAVYNHEVGYGTLRDSYIYKDFSGNIAYWLGDVHFGLNRFYQYYEEPFKIKRNGMNKSLICNIDIFKGKVAVSPSLINNAGTGNYLLEGINILKNSDWSYLECNQDDGTPVMDITSVLWDRTDTTKMWACSWYYGVLQFKNNKPVMPSYTSSNTVMPEDHPNQPRCSGLSMDANGNLWFADSDQKNNLSVIKKNGTYQNFAFDLNPGFTRKTFVDKNNYVWMLHEGNGGVTVFNHRNFDAPQGNVNQGAVNYKILGNSVGAGNLQSNSIYSIAQDKDGKIWIGTSAGISVIYNPTAIFSGGDFDAQPIKIVQDGNVELLLGTEIVSSILVDGANNKWCGTQGGGLYCFSPDGLVQLYHFTKENSPLYSNTIIDINYNEVTGDIFIGTDAGLQSFRGIVIEGDESYNNVYAYPNPVKPNYQGTVLIRGLIDQSIVKITDESGNMVWEAKSTGGQVEWPVTTFANNRVTSGVYVVYAATTGGELKALTKVLVVN